MADPFADALVALFNGPGSDGGVYNGLPDGMRLILESPDRLQSLGEGQVILATHVVLLMRSQVPDPVAGDTIDIVRDGQVAKSLILTGEPMLDAEELTWRMGAEPAE